MAAPPKHSHCSLPWTRGVSSWPLLLTLDVGYCPSAAPVPCSATLLPILDQGEVKIPLITPLCLPCVTFAVPLQGDHCYLGADPAWLGAVSRAEVN